MEDFQKNVKQKVTYIRKDENTGVSDTRNTAAKVAKGEWVAFLDSDDKWDEKHLSTLIQTFLENPDSNFIHSGSVAFDSDTGKILSEGSRNNTAIITLPLSLFTGEYAIQPSSCMVSTDFYKLAGGFNPNLNYCEDMEMCFRHARAGCKFVCTEKNTSYYRKHKQGASADFVKMALGAAQVYSIHSDWTEIPEKIRSKYASSHWLAAARLVRSSNKALAKEYVLNALTYRKTLKNILYWVAYGFLP